MARRREAEPVIAKAVATNGGKHSATGVGGGWRVSDVVIVNLIPRNARAPELTVELTGGSVGPSTIRPTMTGMCQ
jgi:hypothetical protein